MVAERYSVDPDSEQEKRDKKREKDFERVERLKENLMKLEKSVVDEVDEATMQARGAIQAMGFGISPVAQTDDDGIISDDKDDDDSNQ